MATFSLGMDLGLALGGFLAGLVVEAGGFSTLYAVAAASVFLGMIVFWAGMAGARWRTARRAAA